MGVIGVRTGVAVTLAALVLGACAGENDGSASENGGTNGTASTAIAAEATDFRFDPDTWAVPARGEFSIEFTNAGTIVHEWVVLRAGEDIESEDEFAADKVLLEVDEIPAGESVTESFTVEEAGTYQVICGVPGHFDAGMEGTLTVS